MVTGANSLLGANTITVLLANGYTVRGMVRRAGSIPFKDKNMEEYIGAITKKNDVQKAVEGCNYIIHIAANTTQNSIRYKDYFSVNVTATKYVLDAAQKCKILKTIIVGTANAFGYGTLSSPGTEALPFTYPFTRSCYARSKKEAQDFALQYAGIEMGDIVVVNPTFMIGKYDNKPGSGKIITMNYKKRFIFVPPGGKNFIYAKDAAVAICNALQSGKNKQCYLLSNENLSYREFYKRLNEVTGTKSRIIILPKWLLLTAGLLGSVLIRSGLKTSIHYNNMRILCVKNYYDNNKARQELDLPTTDISVAIKDAIDWFQETGML